MDKLVKDRIHERIQVGAVRLDRHHIRLRGGHTGSDKHALPISYRSCDGDLGILVWPKHTRLPISGSSLAKRSPNGITGNGEAAAPPGVYSPVWPKTAIYSIEPVELT